MLSRSFALLAVVAVSTSSVSAQGWKVPPEPIASQIVAMPAPSVSLSPDRRFLLLTYREPMVDIEVQARPHRKLAGSRIDEASRGPQLGLKTQRLVLRDLSNGQERELTVPAGHISNVSWSADGQWLAMTRATDQGLELWFANSGDGAAKKVVGMHLNAVLGSPLQWLPDQRSLLCRMRVDDELPAAPAAPAGPNIQQASGRRAQIRTNRDMLTSEYDAQCFEALGRSQLARVYCPSGVYQEYGEPGLITRASASPDGQYVLLSKIERPFSYLVRWRQFPQRTSLLAIDGDDLGEVASQPLLERVPIGGVQTGPRSVRWLDGHPHTLTWTEALDGGDPRNEAEWRDEVKVLADLPDGQPQTWFKTAFRFRGVQAAADGKLGVASEYDRQTRTERVFLVDVTDFDVAPVVAWERSRQDAYGDPGRPVSTTTAQGKRRLHQQDGALLFSGSGASREGNRPFLNRWTPGEEEHEELWRCADGRYETFVDLLDDDRILIRSESRTEPPNYVAVSLSTGERQPVTAFEDPRQQYAEQIHKELIRYERADGVSLSGTLYLPPGHKKGQKYPTLVWAYPQEFARKSDAGQVRGSPNRYVGFSRSSHLWLLHAGYAVLDGATMPVIGPVRTANDTYVDQLVAAADAACEMLVERGVTPRDQIGIAGHSYGAFMTANLLCHSDLFAAGIARSGAYNRSLTPFGFQNEERTFWEAPEVYLGMSPFAHAEKLEEPILFIHGEDDNNQGTWPLQSQRMFAAVKGHGGTARLVMLPHESHGYRARESVLHCVAEMVEWMDTHVRKAQTDDVSTPADPGRR